MDNDTNALLKEIAALQKEQNELLRRYLWRLRFSLLTMLLITTATAVMLGIYVIRTKSLAPTVPATYRPFGGYGPTLPVPSTPSGVLPQLPQSPYW